MTKSKMLGRKKLAAGFATAFVAGMPGLAPGLFSPAAEAQMVNGQATRHPIETAAEKDQRMAWWRQARFGMFIHWGVYAVPAGTYNGKQIPDLGEHIMRIGRIPLDDYNQYPPQFNPTKYNAQDWVQMAQNAGMQYVVFTAKHHDGFAMFDTAASDFDIIDATPFGRDIVRELADACRAADMPLGLYYSQAQDWTHKGGGVWGEHWDPKQAGDFEAYFTSIVLPQLDEILNNYGPIVTLWFDTPTPEMTPERAQRVLDALKDHPGLVLNDRLGGGFAGDTTTPEQYIPATGYDRDWETCMTMNHTWGFKTFDHDWKSSQQLIRNLVDIVSKGGNYLLNVGPKADGTFPQESIDCLADIGQWMQTNGEAIHGTTASCFKKLPFNGRCTVKGNVLYVHVFDWPAVGLSLPGLTNANIQASSLADGKALNVHATEHNGVPVVHVDRPSELNQNATVLKLVLDGPPVVDESVYAVRPDENGRLTLGALDAFSTGSIRYESDSNKQCLGFWMNTNDQISWPIDNVPAGTYRVAITHSVDVADAGSTVALQIGQNQLRWTVPATDGWVHFDTVDVGRIAIGKGVKTATLQALAKPHGAVMNVRVACLFVLGASSVCLNGRERTPRSSNQAITGWLRWRAACTARRVLLGGR